MERFVSPLRS